MTTPSPRPIRLHLDAEGLAAGLSAMPTGATRAIALVPEAEGPRLPALQAAAVAAGIELSGAIFPALIDEGAFSTEGAWILPLPAEAEVHLLFGLDEAPDAAAAQIAAAVDHRLAPAGGTDAAPMLLLFFDAMLPHIASTLDALYQLIADGAALTGVNAGSERFVPTPCLFGPGVVGDQGALVVLLPPGQRPALAHGFSPPARGRVATATQANRVLSIDWRPAFPVYQELVAANHGVTLTRDNFYTYACKFPLGILRAAGDLVLRFPVALDEDNGLVCIGEIPPSSVLVLVTGTPVDHLGCIETLRAVSFRPTEGTAPPHLLSFYCAGRRLHHGGRANAELEALRADSACSAGALSLGEIGPLRPGGYPLFHNGAIMSGAWPWG